MLRETISDLITTIERQKPESLVYCTEERIPALEALTEQGCRVAHISHFDDLARLPRFELGIVFDYLEQRPADEGVHLLGRLRNLKCEKIWVAVTTSASWNLNAMISLGFTRVKCYGGSDQQLCTYSYDIATYNHKRSWNNSRFWANPENWGKYRW